MSAITSPRRFRAMRAAQRWVEGGGELRGVAQDVVEQAVADEADRLTRDLDLAEVDRTARAAVDAEEQRLAQEAIASARTQELEAERLAYLRKQADFYRLTADSRGGHQ